MCSRRRRPFLIRPLENTLVKLILSLEFYSQEGRQKIAVGARRCCCLKYDWTMLLMGWSDSCFSPHPSYTRVECSIMLWDV